MGDLLPCRQCGSDCRNETFGDPQIEGTVSLWICSAHMRLGGECPSDLAYFSADAWNTLSDNSTSEGDEG